jgi:ABC-type transporter lipoprotein component MlaA
MPQETLGKVASVASITGFTVQTVTAWTSLLVLLINVVLGLGGLYFMWGKHLHNKKSQKRRSDNA